MESRLRTSYAQFAALVEFMERYGDLSQPQSGSQGRLRAERKWRQMADILNAIGGGAQRTPDKWKKVWTDWKSKTKKKAGEIRQHARGTGGGPRCTKTLSVLEERVAAILGKTALEGQHGIQEQGLNRISDNEDMVFHESDARNVDDNSLPASTQVTTPPPRTRTATATSHSDREASPPVAGPSGLSRTQTGTAQESTSLTMPRSPSPQSGPSTPRRRRLQQPRVAASPQSGASTPSRRRGRPQRPRAAMSSQSAVTTAHRRRAQQPQVAATSPASGATTPRRRRRPLQPQQLLSPRRRLTRTTQTPFQQAASEFAAVEMRRLELEHEREARRIEVDREHNELLHRIISIVESFVSTYTLNRQVI